MRIFARIAVTLALTGCGVRDSLDPESGLRISIEDQSRRLGRAPWAVGVFNPYLGPDEALAGWSQGTAAPGQAYVVLRRRDEDVWRVVDFMARDEIHFGLSLPALRRDGYWLARLAHEPSRANAAGAAHFCRWGTIVPSDDVEPLDVSARPVTKEYGFEYEVTVRVPQARAGSR